MKNKTKWAAAAFVLALGLTGAFFAGTSFAAGIPPTGALTYSGLLQDTAGQALAGPQFVEVKLWNHPSATANANVLCDSGTPSSVPLVSGHFSLVLPDACTNAVANNSDVYAEVLVGATAASVASLGRSKLGAVPYAVNADNAVRASSASAADVAAVANAFTARTKPFPGTAVPTSSTAYKIQAGTSVVKVDSTGTARIPFPEPFPNGIATVIATDSFAWNKNVSGLDDDEDTSGFTVIANANTQIRVNWIAIGW